MSLIVRDIPDLLYTKLFGNDTVIVRLLSLGIGYKEVLNWETRGLTSNSQLSTDLAEMEF
jgi:hypothetical protein